MIYEARLSIPPLTDPLAPVVALLEIHPGTLKHVEVVLPSGCVGLVHVSIWYWGHQLFPANPDSDFSGDGADISFEEELDITGAPFEFTVQGWSDDDTYTHTPIVRLSVVPFDKDLIRLFQGLAVGPTGPRSNGGS